MEAREADKRPAGPGRPPSRPPTPKSHLAQVSAVLRLAGLGHGPQLGICKLQPSVLFHSRDCRLWHGSEAPPWPVTRIGPPAVTPMLSVTINLEKSKALGLDFHSCMFFLVLKNSFDNMIMHRIHRHQISLTSLIYNLLRKIIYMVYSFFTVTGNSKCICRIIM